MRTIYGLCDDLLCYLLNGVDSSILEELAGIREMDKSERESAFNAWLNKHENVEVKAGCFSDKIMTIGEIVTILN